ncbi:MULTISPECIES: glycoside hydrolase family 88 protein [unclassified Spirosoma]|uniref:glycoside hydrolase family 88/105 protein n=1 Tax=unclassified Spirosoma TaxID=2621999 RepID=UPI00095AF0E4|nr:MULTISPECIES: glycoside hydrolase family 88 protein [unclassified Spirosoma]MBN8824365.1 glycoside hydrolase family 88 protein [Spirosoma sp.]OJW70171.1 MAG: family 88 glycosyl hydrolase [Spirosoma sp. 48-14]
MKYPPLRCWFALLFCIISSGVQAQKLPGKKKILAKMTLANAYFMKTWPDPGKEIVTNKTRPSNIWTRAVYYEGLMALYGIDKQKAYYDYAVEWGVKHNWGLRSGPKTRNADDQCCGQTYIDLYVMDRDAGNPQPERIRDIKASIDAMVASDKVDDWNWIDALHMAMPVFATLGVLEKNPAYFEKMYQIYSYSKTKHGGHGLYNPDDHLWWRDKDFVPPYKEPNGQDCYWSRGNGWVVAALVRVLNILPKDAPHRDEYQKTYLDMMQALVPLQRPDGYWNVSLHDPTNYGGKELTGTALFVYGMAWGINHGLLDGKTYRPIIAKAWNAMVTESVHPNGFLGYVQGTGKEPKDGQPVTYDSKPDFEDYGLGCFLLAGTELYKLN